MEYSSLRLAAAAKSLQSCPTLCDPIDGRPPGSPVPGILQTRTLEWVAISFSNAWKWKVKGKSLSRVRLLATPWTTAYQAPHPWGFPGKSTGVGCHCLLHLWGLSISILPGFSSPRRISSSSLLAIISMNLLLLFQSWTSFSWSVLFLRENKVLFFERAWKHGGIMTESPAGLWDMFRTVLWGPRWPYHVEDLQLGLSLNDLPNVYKQICGRIRFEIQVYWFQSPWYCQPICASRGERKLAVWLLSRIQLVMTPWTAAQLGSLSFTVSWSLLKFKEKLKNFLKNVFSSPRCALQCIKLKIFFWNTVQGVRWPWWPPVCAASAPVMLRAIKNIEEYDLMGTVVLQEVAVYLWGLGACAGRWGLGWWLNGGRRVKSGRMTWWGGRTVLASLPWPCVEDRGERRPSSRFGLLNQEQKQWV